MRGEDHPLGTVTSPEKGSPPHARGRRLPSSQMGGVRRITPACAGKTSIISLLEYLLWDHPRMRGEDLNVPFLCLAARGSPPHARGRPMRWKESPMWSRITPACAGKTSRPTGRRETEADHPRMRGEDVLKLIFGRLLSGITPACAGKTMSQATISFPPQDHPRMRGEDSFLVLRVQEVDGSPPHARGRQPVDNLTDQETGITPACAGKTGTTSLTPPGQRDHPRMRGEDLEQSSGTVDDVGSPPHARGRRLRPVADKADNRITPACAGKTGS